MRVVAVPAAIKPVQLGLFDPPGPAPDKLALTLTRLVGIVGDDRVGAPAVPDTWRPYAVAVATFDPPRAAVRGGDGEGVPTMALHLFRPPRAADVVLSEGRILRVKSGEIDGHTVAYGGPWRTTGEWWAEGFDHEGVRLWDAAASKDGTAVLGPKFRPLEAEA